MDFCSRILGASISIIIFTSTPVQPQPTVNSTQLHSNLLLHTSNYSTNIHKLQTVNSISVNESILNQYDVGKNDVRTKRSTNTNHNQRYYDHKLSCQPAVPRKNQVHIHKLVEEWINVVSLLDHSNIIQWEQENDNLYINKRNLTHWRVNSSCPTKYTSRYHKKDLLAAQCAYSHQDCHQVEVKVHTNVNMWYHPVGCVHAHQISVEATPRPTDFVNDK